MKRGAAWVTGFSTALFVCLFHLANTAAVQSVPVEPSGLNGTVTVEGVGLEGVAVSARAAGTTVTTTVFTDESGLYRFPVLLTGEYRVWAQAVGYKTGRGAAKLGDQTTSRTNFVLHPIDDLTMQVSGSEWLAALPATTKEQRRMREIFRANCTMCHSPAAVLQQRFDEQGWRAIIDLMLHFNRPPTINALVDKHTTIAHHRHELAKYLATVRGPDSPPLKFTPHPRPTGDAARVVITEWDIPVANRPDGLAWFGGSDWSEGVATSGARDALLHDVIVDDYGNAWLTALGTAAQSILRLNVRTAQVTAFNIKAANGRNRSTHGMTRDDEGIIWFDMFGSLGRIDPATETIEVLTPPRNMSAGNEISTDVDGKGKVWSSTRFGSIRFDPVTKEWMYLQNVTVADGLSYGNAGDIDGNGWWAQFQADRLGKGDPITGRSHEVIMRPPWANDEEDVLTAADKAYYESVGALTWGKINMIPGAQAPRRMAADKRGEWVWAANYLGNNLARVNIRTLETTYYRVPVEGHPYMVAVDKDHNAWTNLHSDDRILKLNPKTGGWTVYRLPGNGCETRHISIDHLRNEVWVPCHRTSKVVRLQFRSPELEQVQTAGVRSSAPIATPAVTPGPGIERVDYDMKQVVDPSVLSERALQGRKLFVQRCAACHDLGGDGTPYGPRVDASRLAVLGEAAARTKIAEGSTRMPGFQYMLTHEQVSDILDFIQSR